MWSEKYRPETLDDYRGASKQKEELKEFVENWEKGDGAVLLHGPAGTGKTSLVHALANDLGYELVETNASDVRTKKKLKSELKEATRQASFFGDDKLILIDEVDGMSSRDRGGTKELSRIVDESRFPVVMTANDAYSQNIRGLKNKAELIEIGKVHTNSIAAYLKDILDQEGVEYDDGAVKRLARQANGQMRSAINDLEAAVSGSDKFTKENLEVLGVRDDRKDVFDSLKMIFKTMDADTADQATENLDEDPDTFMQWVRENVPREYEREEDVSRAYNWVSKADVFNGRIRSSQNWKLLKYVYLYLTVGVALSKDEKYSGWTKYQYPSKIRKMGSSRSSRRKLEAVSSKIGEKLHISVNQSKAVVPFVAKLLEQDSEMQRFFELDDDEVEFVKKF